MGDPNMIPDARPHCQNRANCNSLSDTHCRVCANTARARGGPWSKDEDAILVMHRERGLTFALISRLYLTDRSASAVKERYRILAPGERKRGRPTGISREIAKLPHGFWTAQEDRRLIEGRANGVKFAEICRRFLPGRTPEAAAYRYAKIRPPEPAGATRIVIRVPGDMTPEEYGSRSLFRAYLTYFRKYHPDSELARLAA